MSRPSIHTGAERAMAASRAGASLAVRAALEENANAHGAYGFDCWRPVPARLDEYVALRDRLQAILAAGVRLTRELWEEMDRIRARMRQIPRELVWQDAWAPNLVTTEGKNAALTHVLKGSSYTASQVLGLIEDTGYSAVAVGNTAANITAAGGGSPANGWNEAPSATCATRGSPTFGTASSGSLATSSAVAMSMLATDTIKGAFLLMRSAAGTAPTTTVGNTNGALYSAGLFSGGDRSVANGDTLNVSYTASL
jgi:hypothetical protein